MEGGRERFQCPHCGRVFRFWVQTTNPHPKIKCSFCAKESFPKGEPATPPAAPPKAAGMKAADAAAPAAPKPEATPIVN